MKRGSFSFFGQMRTLPYLGSAALVRGTVSLVLRYLWKGLWDGPSWVLSLQRPGTAFSALGPQGFSQQHLNHTADVVAAQALWNICLQHSQMAYYFLWWGASRALHPLLN